MTCAACTPLLDALLAGESSLLELWARLPRRTLSPGQRLFVVGDTVAGVWRVEKGLMRLLYESPDGEERNRSFHREGQWVGAGFPPVAAISAFSAEALERCELVALTYEQLRQAQAASQAVGQMLTDALAHVFAETARRESSLLMLDAAARYEAFRKESPELEARVALHHVAAYLGITNVALSRIRRRLGLSSPRRHRSGHEGAVHRADRAATIPSRSSIRASDRNASERPNCKR